ncbi:hypothetical protein [Paenibacillus sp. LHD-38]|uniref:hypothetical protein n=1 Tax=Paenibacillus sp. LHD-38 TaxID=3072143 RepID=UPI00280DA748|nr:hypothetical protein [Paenibacillus sp. LHD-38]MDQ8739509.1 hypothetical protein [Paenibacillus sp. LHD-38]
MKKILLGDILGTGIIVFLLSLPIMAVLSIYGQWYYFKIVLFTMLAFTIGCLGLFQLWLTWYNRIKLGNKSANMIYNPVHGMIELHLGTKMTQKEFIKVMKDIKKFSKTINKSIVFCTTNYSKKRLEEKFAERISIENVRGYQWITSKLMIKLVMMGTKIATNNPVIIGIYKP